MEETRLDKFVGKVFNRVENATEFLRDETKKRKVFSRLMILQILIGLVFIFILFASPNDPKTPTILKIIRYLQIPATIILPIYFLYKLKFVSDIDLKILKFSQKFYSEETRKLCFEPIIADWKKEYSESISQNKNWQARWISIRYVYAYLSAMMQQSRFGRLFELLRKLF